MLVVGLTGNIGSGKSSVARALAARGVRVIDADVLAREAVGRGSPALARIVARWGRDVIGEDGAVDRAALRARVFSHREELEALNAIVHPEVLRRRDELLSAARSAGEPVVVCDIPLLFEARLTGDVDVVLLVDAPLEVRLERLVRDRKLDRAEATAMIAAQMPAELKRAGADYVIDNAGSPDALASRVEEVWGQIAARAGVTSA
jgi:dephospho-CoA kinase